MALLKTFVGRGCVQFLFFYMDHDFLMYSSFYVFINGLDFDFIRVI